MLLHQELGDRVLNAEYRNGGEGERDRAAQIIRAWFKGEDMVTGGKSVAPRKYRPRGAPER